MSNDEFKVVRDLGDRLNDVETKEDFLELWEEAAEIKDELIRGLADEMLASSGHGDWIPEE